MKKTLLLYPVLLTLWIADSLGQGKTCSTALPVCTSDIYTFPAQTNTTAPAGPAYGCLATRPNPAWYYLKMAVSGNIVITMASTPAVDIDFICWGPFPTATGACLAGLTAAKIVSCSYSVAPIENCNIPASAMVGNYFIMLITNYSNLPCSITFTKTSGTGATDCGIVVPVTLADFRAIPSQNQVSLKWKTFSEANSSHFIVERSTNGENFEEISVVKAAGFSNVENSYEIFDKMPLKGVSYYRLRQLDMDGNEVLTRHLPVMMSSKKMIKNLNYYPNPASGSDLHLNFLSSHEGEANFSVKDMSGRLILNQNGHISEGENSLVLSVNDLPTGAYIVETSMEGTDPVRMRFFKTGN